MAPAAEEDVNVDFYELLSIPAQATESEIRRAYRKTSLLYHPDKVKTTPETSAKFQLLQVALNILTDPAEKAKYDQTREAKQKRLAENAALEGRRRKMKEDLENRESGINGGTTTPVNGVKRTWTDRELEVKRIAEENRKRREAMMQEKAQKAQDNDLEAEKPTDAIERSVKMRWVKEGDGLDIDETSLRESSERYGKVENVLVLKDKKRRLEGKERKVVFGTAVVVFSTLLAAKKAVAGGPFNGTESIAWAADKEREPS